VERRVAERQTERRERQIEDEHQRSNYFV